MCISDLVMVQQYYKENMGLYISPRLQFVPSVPAPRCMQISYLL